MNRDNHLTDLSPERIAAAAERIEAAFLHTPQFVSDELSAALEREVVVKDETVTPIGSFKGRGTWLLAEKLDPVKTWVCSTAGNFGQGLAYAARARGAIVEAFVSRGPIREDRRDARARSPRPYGRAPGVGGSRTRGGR
jgi:threonine dehydratase